jgi:phosphoglycerol transferase MdoB-like AlkP superfamily enzyme
MRTEYGVIFGRSEAQLGFRRFDPYLTALGETSFALPARLAAGGWRSLFVHPHDMRFYNRAEILAAGGFTELIGEDRFAPPGPGEGRYVTDAAIADVIVDFAHAAVGPTLIYAVTIENHGPWDAGGGDLREGYLRLVRKGDAMLGSLIERLGRLDRPVTLVFFGDHRPSIPGHVLPGGDRHTPYVILDLGKGATPQAQASFSSTITSAEMHEVLLNAAMRPR